MCIGVTRKVLIKVQESRTLNEEKKKRRRRKRRSEAKRSAKARRNKFNILALEIIEYVRTYGTYATTIIE